MRMSRAHSLAWGLRVRVDATREALVFATTVLDKMPKFAAMSTIPKKNLRASDPLECKPIGRRNDSRPTSAAVMFGRDEHSVSGFPWRPLGDCFPGCLTSLA